MAKAKQDTRDGIRIRTNKDGTVSYQATVRIVGQPPLTSTYDDRDQAKRWRESTIAMARQTVMPIANTKSYRQMTLGDAIDKYVLTPECKRTAKIHLATVKRHYGSARLGNITKEWTLQYIQDMKKTDSTHGRPFMMATICRQMDCMRSVVRYTAEMNGVEPPIKALSKKLLGDDWQVDRDRLLSNGEYKMLCEEFKGRPKSTHWRLLLDLALETAARQGELVLAEAKEFDMVRRVWTIPKEHTKAKKTRYVPLSKKATETATRLLELLEEENGFIRELDPHAPLKTRVFFQFSSPSSVCTNFAKIVKKLRFHDLHWHDTRHTAITNMVLYKTKLTLTHIMDIVGHSSPQMTAHYTHLRGDKALVDAME
jgi:integrase